MKLAPSPRQFWKQNRLESLDSEIVGAKDGSPRRRLRVLGYEPVDLIRGAGPPNSLLSRHLEASEIRPNLVKSSHSIRVQPHERGNFPSIVGIAGELERTPHVGSDPGFISFCNNVPT